MATVGISRRSKWVVAARAVVCGLLAGVLAACYRQGIGLATKFAKWMYPQMLHNSWLIAPWALAAVAVGLLVAWLVRLEPMASGSGIPQVEGVVRLGLKMRWALVLVVRFIGGILCGMFGLSLGREGPSVQIGAATAQGTQQGMRWLRIRREIASSDYSSSTVGIGAAKSENVESENVEPKNMQSDTMQSQIDQTQKPDNSQENVLVTAGAAAGLSAAFSAPLSGVMFALEEVHHSFSPAILLGAAGAALSADVVAKIWFGLQPVLDFTRLSQLSLPQYWWIVPLGLLSGLIGVLMNRLLLGAQTLYNRLPWWSRPLIALTVALPVGLFLPQVLGGGEGVIGDAERHGLAIGLAGLLVLLVVKMLFTATSFGSGVPGGIFMPILAVGTLVGAVYGVALHSVSFHGFGVTIGAGNVAVNATTASAVSSFGFAFNGSTAGGFVPQSIIPIFAVCAMAGVLTASVQAPLTSILLTVEMSGTLVHMLPVALCSFLALMVSDLTGTEPIYDALLERYVAAHPEDEPAEIRARQ